MRKRQKYVAIVQNGELSIHMSHHNGSYATACGIDGTDDHFSVDQSTVDVPPGAIIDCKDCLQIWEEARRYTKRDFVMRNP